LTEFLTVNGYEVLTSQNAGDTLMLLAVSSPDVVLLDIGMPGLDGLAALRRIRAIHPELPVILSGNADVHVARGALIRGAFDYVAKPFDCNHLAHVIASALSRRGA